jgi:hypothetical protein
MKYLPLYEFRNIMGSSTLRGVLWYRFLGFDASLNNPYASSPLSRIENNANLLEFNLVDSLFEETI